MTTNATPEIIPYKVWVGGLSQSSSNDSLTVFFRQFGEVVESFIVQDRQTLKNKGCAFITFKTTEEAMYCLSRAEDGKLFIDNKQVDVRTALKPNTSHSSAASNRNPGQQNNNPLMSIVPHVPPVASLLPPLSLPLPARQPEYKIYVAGLIDCHTEQVLRDYFSSCGEIAQIKVVFPAHYDQTSERLGTKGYAFIQFNSLEAYQKSLQYSSIHLAGINVDVKPCVDRNQTRQSIMHNHNFTMPSPMMMLPSPPPPQLYVDPYLGSNNEQDYIVVSRAEYQNHLRPQYYPVPYHAPPLPSYAPYPYQRVVHNNTEVSRDDRDKSRGRDRERKRDGDHGSRSRERDRERDRSSRSSDNDDRRRDRDRSPIGRYHVR